MKRYVWLIIFCVIIVSIIGCGRKKGAEKEIKDKGNILATVGDRVITLSEFNERIESLPDNVKLIAESNKVAYLENLILEILLYKEALKKRLDKEKEIQELFERNMLGLIG